MRIDEIDVRSVDHVLRTTRSVRKRLDLGRPVPRVVIEECLDIALQAPTGGNSQTWRFLVVTDAEKRRKIGELYRRGSEPYLAGQTALTRVRISAATESYAPEDPRGQRAPQVIESAVHLIEHMGDAPVLVIACLEGRVENDDLFTQASFYGCILPAAWSLMLALRARGLGSSWTTLHLIHEKEAAALLGIPADVTQAVLLPIAYFTGDDFQPARRLPVRQVTYWDEWGRSG